MNLKHFSFKTTDPVAAQLDALRPLNTADVVERLNKLKPALADATFAGLSDERAINVLEAPELLRAPQLLQALPRPRRARVLKFRAAQSRRRHQEPPSMPISRCHPLDACEIVTSACVTPPSAWRA